MERALEAANVMVDVLDFASGQLDNITKSGLKRCPSLIILSTCLIPLEISPETHFTDVTFHPSELKTLHVQNEVGEHKTSRESCHMQCKGVDSGSFSASAHHKAGTQG